MSTTSLFVDFLVIGIQVAVWAALLLLTFAGIKPDALVVIKGWETLITLACLPIVYPVGIFVDNVADSFFHKWQSAIRESHGIGRNAVTKIAMANKNDYLNKYFDYVRSRVRLSRSSALNILLITVSAIAYCVIVLGFPIRVVLWIMIAGIAFVSLAVYTWWSVTTDLATKIKQFEDELTNQGESSA